MTKNYIGIDLVTNSNGRKSEIVNFDIYKFFERKIQDHFHSVPIHSALKQMKILNTRRIEIIRFHSSDDSKIVSFALNWTVEFSFWREICRNFWKISTRVKLNYQKLETFFSLFRTKKGKRSPFPVVRSIPHT